MKKLLILSAIVCTTTLIAMPQYASAQSQTMDDIHLFQAFFRDASVSTNTYGEANLTYLDYEGGSQILIGPKVGIPLTPKIEVGGTISYVSTNPEGDADGRSGISDFAIYGRYNVYMEQTKIAIGPYISLPTRSDELGEGQTNFGFFGAVRHPLSKEVVLTGNLGIDFLETGDDDREAQVNLGLGVIYAATQEVSLISELQFQSETEYSNLSAGIDYLLGDGHLRGALLLGIGDASPDFGLSASYLIYF